MNIRFVAALLSMSTFAACSTTSQLTAHNDTLEQKTKTKYAYDVNSQQPAPPAEGPEDATGPNDVNRNPALMPSPLLRYWASSRTP